MKKNVKRVILITGLSGSGKTSALHSLEDLGYYCIDNLSPNMVIEIVKSSFKSDVPIDKIAISIDIRSMKMAKNIVSDIDNMYDFFLNENISNTTIYLHASTRILSSRFNATRRLHPLSSRIISLNASIKKEMNFLKFLKEKSDLIIDTDKLIPSDLKDSIITLVKSVKHKNDILIQLQSFGYKYGIPEDSDFVFDVRCLKNPFWDEKLRDLNGKHKKIINFLEDDDQTPRMLKSVLSFLNTWIPKILKSDRNYLTISTGCTGGHHRSVYITEKLYKSLKSKYNKIIIKHRDIN
tara:strand:+ start:3486 stop:4367 length:882 start_codon:yes stop_codon:yes gene_type:complete